MAFPNGTTTLWLPLAANAGASQWGSDVRKILNAAEASADSTTVFNLGTGGTVTRTADPYSTSTADLVQADYGWAVTPSDMGSTAGAKRVIPAGNHVCALNVTISVAFTTEAKALTLFAYRVGPAAGRTRTLLGSVTGAFPLTTGACTGLTLALPELVFNNDETLQYSFEAVAGGLAVIGRTVSMAIGDSNCTITTPAWETYAIGTGAASGGGLAAGVLAAIGVLLGAASGLATVSGVMGGVAEATGSSSGVATVSGALAAVGGMVGSSAGIASAAGSLAAVGGMVGSSTGIAVGSGAGAIVLPTVGGANGVATVAGTLAAVGGMVGSAAGVATASGSMGAVAEAVGSAAGVATVNGSLAAVLGTVGSVVIGAAGGGGDVYVTQIFAVLD